MNHDGVLAFGGCDKNMPGCVMAMARLNVPSIFVYGGSILPGIGPNTAKMSTSSRSSRPSAVTKRASSTRTGVHKIECESCPGAGSCGGMYTANTMSSAIEAMGMSLPYDASYPAVSAAKEREAFMAGQALDPADRARTSARATSSRASRWKTRTRWCWRSAVRPTRCCI